MESDLKLLILEWSGHRRELGEAIARTKALTDITSLGAKVRHDSGGRLVIVDTSGVDEANLAKNLSGARLVPLDGDVRGSIEDLNETESLFLDALRIRTSHAYRVTKERQQPGETPEERAMFSAPCTPEM